MRRRGALDDAAGARGLACEAHLEGLQPAEQEPRGVGPGTGPVRAELEQARRVSSSRQTTAPTSASSCPARYFVAEWSARSQPSSSGRTFSGVAAVESQTHTGGMGGGRLEVRHRQERVRGRLEPDEVGALRRRRRSGRTRRAEAPTAELAQQHAGAVVRAFRERDGLPGLEQGQHDRRGRRGARGEEKRVAAVELAERGARPPRRSGSRSARRRTRPARRPRTARSSSGRSGVLGTPRRIRLPGRPPSPRSACSVPCASSGGTPWASPSRAARPGSLLKG